MADAVETARQHVQQEAARELIRFEGHGLVACASVHAVVLPAEGDTVFVERDQALVGDRDPVHNATDRRAPLWVPQTGVWHTPPTQMRALAQATWQRRRRG